MKVRKHWYGLYFLTIAGVLIIAYGGSKAVTTIAELTPMEERCCVVVDAGHGGIDGGAISCTRIPESTYNLEIALRLSDLLHFLGYDTRMIRTEDISIYTKGETIAEKKISDLKERVRIVNETKNAILVSIHQNTFSDSRYNGAQVFYAATAGSEQLAKQIQAAFAAIYNTGNNRKCKKTRGVYLLDHIAKPGVLVECGFLSNPSEEKQLRSADYQKKISCVIASSISVFLSNT